VSERPSLAEMLAAASVQQPLADAPGKSGARLERVVIDGRGYVLKHLDLGADWTMRASGSLRGVPLELWERGILDRLPACINQPIVAVGYEPPAGTAARPGGRTAPSPPAGGCAVLMADVADWLVPATDEPISARQHHDFLRHMAAMHAAYWDCGSEYEVVPAMHRYLELSPWLADAEAYLGSDHLVPQLVGKGWSLLPEVAPAAAEVVSPLALDPGPLVTALAQTPQTFVHSNWKLDNLGTDDAGRTVVLDWEQPGRGAALSDLAWYLAINCRRLPDTKEASIEAYRAALEACGVDTGSWWETQLALSLLGALVLFGWEKALGGYDEELAWWEDRAIRARPLLG
jgi:hypothetical protein